ncbi:MAG: tetraacyldisaccharide 4'-kinase [Candidatus Liberibacter ctenarytainae]|uniref:Tetraacyldisaccharide 4'-kinase n=1 Tax=Candidatus Liberibacter ctenarytainae TaxID=2020335 RepID=A0A937DIQ6_9HYPH|nr:tetraacyldisaccharide 4'-kinase [Candidatus Liberibacter ctenarytainae]
MIKSPLFWWKSFSLYSLALYPFSFIYGLIASRMMKNGSRWNIPVPILCIGNFVMGGAGKTPTALAMASAIINRNLKPGFLSRGYGRKLKSAHRVDLEKHGSYDVGDEPLLLAHKAVTVVANDRRIGAQMLLQEGVDIIIMDDGFHSADLKTDFSLLIVDSFRGLGNGFVFPSGPLRVPLSTQLLYVDAILYVGDSKNIISGIDMKRTYFAQLKPRQGLNLSDVRVLAFAGIADTDKFFITLQNLGAILVERYSFGDHAYLSDKEMDFLIDRAERENLVLVTTEKDAMRLRKRSGISKNLLSQSMVIGVEMVFENPENPASIVEETFASFYKKQSLSQ